MQHQGNSKPAIFMQSSGKAAHKWVGAERHRILELARVIAPFRDGGTICCTFVVLSFTTVLERFVADQDIVIGKSKE